MWALIAGAFRAVERVQDDLGSPHEPSTEGCS
jgi:hypothetical protein